MIEEMNLNLTENLEIKCESENLKANRT